MDSTGRPDIVTFDSGILAELDLSLAHLFNKELIETSTGFSGRAASVQEAEKKAKYHQFCHPGGFNPDMTPLVFEHFSK